MAIAMHSSPNSVVPVVPMILLPLVVVQLLFPVPIECCSIDKNRLRCQCDTDGGESMFLDSRILVFHHEPSMEFEKIILENCRFPVANKNSLAISFRFYQLVLKDVELGQVPADGFAGFRSEMVNNFTHVNRNGYQCPRFEPANGNNYLAAIRTMSKLRYLELCAVNNGDSIPAEAFAGLDNLEIIRLNGNDSNYAIETDAFTGKNLKSIVFDHMQFRFIGPNAFNLKQRTDIRFSVQIIFNRCSFGNFRDTLDPDFSQNSTQPIHLTINPKNMVPIEYIRMFDRFLASETNRLTIFGVICTHRSVNELQKRYGSQLHLGCSVFIDHPMRLSLNASRLSFLKKVAETRFNDFSDAEQEAWFSDVDEAMAETNSSSEVLDIVEMIPTILNPVKFLNESNQSVVLEKSNMVLKMKSFETRIANIDDDSIDLLKDVQGGLVVKIKIKNHIVVNGQTSNHQLLNSDVFSYNIIKNQQRMAINKADVKLRFKNVRQRKYSDTVRCVFWDQSKNDWSRRGCEFVPEESSKNSTVCRCNHLTSFAVLFDISGREAENGHNQVKEILTYVCCSFSIFGLLISIGLMFRFGKEKFFLHNDQFRWRINRWVISMNTAICLLATNLLTIFGLDRRDGSDQICLTVSISLLFFLLSAFCFMLLQGYHLYKSTMNPLTFDFNYANYYILGYGTPIIIIVILFVAIFLNQHSIEKVMMSEFFCYLSTRESKYYFLAIIVPVTVSILLNVGFFISIIFFLFRRNYFIKKDREQHQNLRSSSTCSSSLQISAWKQVSSLVLLGLNLGITWLLFFIYISDHMHYFSYLFIVINGSQGLFFLLSQLMSLKAKGGFSFKIMKSSRTLASTATTSISSVASISLSQESCAKSRFDGLANRMKNGLKN